MSFDIFGWIAFQIFLTVVVPATAFLLVFNVVLALVEQVHVITNSQDRQS